MHNHKITECKGSIHACFSVSLGTCSNPPNPTVAQRQGSRSEDPVDGKSLKIHVGTPSGLGPDSPTSLLARSLLSSLSPSLLLCSLSLSLCPINMPLFRGARKNAEMQQPGNLLICDQFLFRNETNIISSNWRILLIIPEKSFSATLATLHF